MLNNSSLASAFDLSNQPGVMAVLAAVRASSISPSEKNELRDLVFSYTNGGKDPSVLIALEQKLIAHQIKPVILKSNTPSQLPAFGAYRPVPSFKTPTVTTTQLSTKSIENVNIPPTPVSDKPVPKLETPPPESVVPQDQVTPPQPPVVSIDNSRQQTETTPRQPVVNINKVANTPPPRVSMNQQETVDESLYLDRIKQIKTAVNSKVGNPVNLVDIDNEVGREYMNALLEAMKKLGSGAISEMAPAMQRLEDAFAAVELAIERRGEVLKTEIKTKSAETLNITKQPSKSEEIDNRTVPPTREEQTPPVVTETVVQSKIDSSVLHTPPKPPKKPVITTPTLPVVAEASSVMERSGFEEGVTPYSAPEVAIKVAPILPPSLAGMRPLKTPLDLPDPKSVDSSANGDLLHTKEIDDGLEQLLSDWSLFKKSGLFGAGPKGRQHPLFKKIADLQIPLLLAGRFEGATQEIRQSITDYMNGWRYEQGIIYQPGETFERYLRRVIHHIITGTTVE